MPDQIPQRRAKVAGSGATHRSGTLRAAVKPSARPAPRAQLVGDYMKSLKPGSTSHTMWGDAVARHAGTLRGNFGLSASDEPYLLLDSGGGSGRAGLLLSASGVHLGDGRGGVTDLTWGDLAGTPVACQGSTLLIGKSAISSPDAPALAELLKRLQA